MAKRSILLALLLAITMPIAVTADDNPCPCIPKSLVWVVEACETWNCAQAAMVNANGDPFVLSMPTADTQWKWIVMRRVVAGSATVSPDSPFLIDSYSQFSDALSQYTTIDKSALPMMFSAVDGAMLVVRLKDPNAAHRRPTVR
ncbi:MAG TPA: hypothetical protein VGR02_05965 [Thermoanaerobaculia bacterium]|jgi:hypothetical protein|nr:hypothetical protein [Thermoanaerobaculia bacterium]